MNPNPVLVAGTSELYHANSVDALIPEIWANEALMQLEENMVIANLVHRDFVNSVASFGDTVNTRRPASYTAKRKTANDDVTVQDTTLTNVAVPLDQQLHVSFMLRDAELSFAMPQLFQMHLIPAMRAMARQLDRIILGQYPQFLANIAGGLGQLTESNAKSYILAARNRMNINKAPEMPRHLIWSPSGETAALGTELFVSADKRGDGGQALREARLGRVLGFEHYMAQNASEIDDSNIDKVTGAVDLAAGYAVGTTTLVVDGFSAAIAAGTWIKINGRPYRVASTSGGATPVGITIPSPGLTAAVADNDVITVYDPAAVNLVAGYAAGWSKYIIIDGFTKVPQAGQLVTFGANTTGAIYTIVDYTSNTILLDRPLEAALSNDDPVNLGPGGQFNFAFHPNAIALVNRPLMAVDASLGARSTTVSYNGASMRVTITYNGTSQGVLVTFDMLVGVKVLDTALGCILVG